jgi:hypothetical protein
LGLRNAQPYFLLEVAHISHANRPPVGKNTNAALKLSEKGFNPKTIPTIAVADSRNIRAKAALMENRSSSAVTPVART